MLLRHVRMPVPSYPQMAPLIRLELITNTLEGCCSSNWATRVYWCLGWDSNPQNAGFKPAVSANLTTQTYLVRSFMSVILSVKLHYTAYSRPHQYSVIHSPTTKYGACDWSWTSTPLRTAPFEGTVSTFSPHRHGRSERTCTFTSTLMRGVFYYLNYGAIWRKWLDSNQHGNKSPTHSFQDYPLTS